MKLKEWQILRLWKNGYPAGIYGQPIKAELAQTHDDKHDAEPVPSKQVAELEIVEARS